MMGAQIFWLSVTLMVAALAVIGALSWQHRRDPLSLLGLAFAVIAVVSSVNITLVAHQLKLEVQRSDAAFDNRIACTQSIVAALKERDEIMAAGGDPRTVSFPAC